MWRVDKKAERRISSVSDTSIGLDDWLSTVLHQTSISIFVVLNSLNPTEQRTSEIKKK